MNTHHPSDMELLVDLCRRVSFHSLTDNAGDILAQASASSQPLVKTLLEIFDNEWQHRSRTAQRRRIRAAAFPELKYLHELQVEDLPAEARRALPGLSSLEFISQGRNVILYGNPGTGKTHIATALGIAACEKGHSVLFTSVPGLLTSIREARSQTRLSQLQNKFEKYDLVICDEFGYVSCDKEGAEMLFNHISLRGERKSTLVTTNLSFSRWCEIIPDKVLVNALVDRITHKAHIINMTGESFRLKETQRLQQKNNL